MLSLNERGIKRVFIIGAGFSALFGMPLTDQLLKLIHDVASNEPWDGDDGALRYGFADILLKKLNWYFPTLSLTHEMIQKGELRIDMEKFMSYVSAGSAFESDPFSEEGDKFLFFLKLCIGKAIYQKQKEAFQKEVPSPYLLFSKSLQNSMILTFNWDTIIEQLLEQENQPYIFDFPSSFQTNKVSAFPPEPINSISEQCLQTESHELSPLRTADKIPIIKLHGSIDWFKDERINLDKRFIDKLGLSPVSHHIEDIYRTNEDSSKAYESHFAPQIVIPSYDKINQIKSLGSIWENPWIYLKDKLEIVIIGFSMREDDYHSRAFIYPQLVHGSRNGNLKIKVIDLADNEEKESEIKRRYEGVENCEFRFNGFSENVWDFIEG